MPKPRRTAVGAIPVASKTDPVATQPDDPKPVQMRKEAATDSRGGPLTDPGPLHPTLTVEESAAYRTADGKRHGKETR